MKRPHGAPPVTLCVVTAGLLVLHVAIILHIRHQIPKLEARVQAENLTLVPKRNFEDDGIPVRYRPSGTLSGDAGMLAALQVLDRALPRYLWVTGCFFLGSLIWIRDPRTD